jgi:uncharacterized protein
MALMEQIGGMMKQAMKDKDQNALNALRSLKSAFKYKEVEAGGGGELSEGDMLQVIQKEVKKRRESIEQFKQGGRQDLVGIEEAQLAVIEIFLPKELADDEIEAKAKAVIAELGASTKREIGNVMKKLMPEMQGRADGKRVNQIVSKLLD